MARIKNILVPVDVSDASKAALRYGEAVLPVHLSATVPPGQLFATFHTRAAFLNCVTSPNRDGIVDPPEYKLTAVRLERQSPGAPLCRAAAST
jgi:formate dehydrogenase major subunit